MTSAATLPVNQQHRATTQRRNRKDVLVTVRLEEDLIEEIEEVLRATGLISRSAFIRKAIHNELTREKRQQELDAIEWEEKVSRVRGSGSDDPFPKEK